MKSISYHQGGSSRRAKGAQPFAIIDLEVSYVVGLLTPLLWTVVRALCLFFQGGVGVIVACC